MLSHALSELMKDPTDHLSVFDIALTEAAGCHPAYVVVIFNDGDRSSQPRRGNGRGNSSRRPAKDDYIETFL